MKNVISNKMTRNISVVIVVVVFFGLLIFIGQAEDITDDPLYINLMDSPIYISTGFSDATPKIENPDAYNWDFIRPVESADTIVMNNFADNSNFSKRKFLSIYEPKPQSYTVLIPFDLSENAIELMSKTHPTVPGMYFAGIGDNWEIFINGKSVQKEIHIGPDGIIDSNRNVRALYFPINAVSLREGTNILTIHILGPPHSGYTGLSYVSPYYFGDYSKISNQSNNALTIIFCSIYVFAGIYHMLIFFMRKRDRYNLTFSFFAICVGIYFLSRSNIIYNISENTAIVQRIEFAALYITLFLLAAFIEQLSFEKLKPITKIYGIICIVFLILQSVFSLQFAFDLLTVWQVLAMIMVAYILIYNVFYVFISRTKAKYLKEKIDNPSVSAVSVANSEMWVTSLGNIIIALLFLLFTTIFDILDAAVFHTGVMLSRYTFFIFIVCVAFILAKQYADAFNLTSQSNEILEETVKERTKKLEEQVHKANAASRAKSVFLANMSHEIRTPLNAVIGMTSIGKSADQIERKDYCFTKIDEASVHLLGVINDILDMSKIEADELELSKIDFSFYDMISKIKNVMTFKTEEKGQDFKIVIDEMIPKYLNGDDQRLTQIIVNLLSNANKFTGEGGQITLRAKLLRIKNDKCVIKVDVSDNGIGISEEQKQRLFKSFHQADSSTSRNYGGTGLGLAISKRIVELMNGKIWLESGSGSGTTFSFEVELDVADATKFENHFEQDEEAEEIVKDEFKGYVALLVEDVDINREIVLALLEESALEIDIAQNGAEALTFVAADPARYDIVLMDIQMPVMDGYESTRCIRELDDEKAKTVPIIAMTANVFKDDVENAIASGMNEHIGKPIDLNELLRILRKYLKRDGASEIAAKKPFFLS